MEVEFGATPLPEDHWGSREGYETYEDLDYRLDVWPKLPPDDLQPHYRQVTLRFASVPRYGFVCPCCSGVIPGGAKSADSFRVHIRDYLSGGGCSVKPVIKRLVPVSGGL